MVGLSRRRQDDLGAAAGADSWQTSICQGSRPGRAMSARSSWRSRIRDDHRRGRVRPGDDVVPGDVFLGTPGIEESNRILVGGVPTRGLVPGKDLLGARRMRRRRRPDRRHAARQDISRSGAISRSGRRRRRPHHDDAAVRHTARPPFAPITDAPLLLIVGTSAEVGKTTAGLAVLRALRKNGYRSVVV